MEVDFDKDSEIIELKPKKKYPAGHDMSISFCEDYICFTFYEKGIYTNVQIDYDEWYQMTRMFSYIKNKFGMNNWRK